MDWNQSPLTLEAERNRMAKDAAVRKHRERALTRYELRVGYRVNDYDLSRSVKAACSAWLRRRGVHMTRSQYFEWQARIGQAEKLTTANS